MLVTEAPFFHDSGTEILDDDVEVGDKAAGDIACFLSAEIERHGLLRAVVALEVGGESGFVATVGTAGFAAGLLDLNDLGAHFGEEHCSEGALLVAG